LNIIRSVAIAAIVLAGFAGVAPSFAAEGMANRGIVYVDDVDGMLPMVRSDTPVALLLREGHTVFCTSTTGLQDLAQTGQVSASVYAVAPPARTDQCIPTLNPFTGELL